MKKSTCHILNKAHAVLVRNPNATFRDIAVGADIGRATLYRHFINRDDLIEKLALMILDEIKENHTEIIANGGSAKNRLSEIIKRLIEMENRYFLNALADVFANNKKISIEYFGQVSHLNQLIEEAKAEGSISEELPTAWISHHLDALIYGAWSCIQQNNLKTKEVIPLAIKTFFSGVEPQDKARGFEE